MRSSLSVQLGIVPALSVLMAFLAACTNAVETENNYDALQVDTLAQLAGEMQTIYADAGAEEVFRFAQNDTRVTDVVTYLQDQGLQSELDLINRAANERRLPWTDILAGRDVPMDTDIENAFSTIHNALQDAPDVADYLAASEDVGAAREALVWWVIAIIVVAAVAAIAVLVSFACAAICRYTCSPNPVQSCMGGSVQASSKQAAVPLCNPVCQPTPPPPPAPPPAPPVVIPPPPCPEPSTGQNMQRCEQQRQACRATGGVPVDGTAARCNCSVRCVSAPEAPPPVRTGEIENR